MSNIAVFHSEAELKTQTTRKTFVNLVVKMVPVWPSKSTRKLMKKIKTRFTASILLF